MRVGLHTHAHTHSLSPLIPDNRLLHTLLGQSRGRECVLSSSKSGGPREIEIHKHWVGTENRHQTPDRQDDDTSIFFVAGWFRSWVVSSPPSWGTLTCTHHTCDSRVTVVVDDEQGEGAVWEGNDGSKRYEFNQKSHHAFLPRRHRSISLQPLPLSAAPSFPHDRRPRERRDRAY
jgi:hypothetical protein